MAFPASPSESTLNDPSLSTKGPTVSHLGPLRPREWPLPREKPRQIGVRDAFPKGGTGGRLRGSWMNSRFSRPWNIGSIVIPLALRNARSFARTETSSVGSISSGAVPQTVLAGRALVALQSGSRSPARSCHYWRTFRSLSPFIASPGPSHSPIVPSIWDGEERSETFPDVSFFECRGVDARCQAQ